MEITFGPAFKKAFKKKIKGQKDLEREFWERVGIFVSNPFDARLKTHKLTGRLKDLWSFTVQYDVRVVFSFENGEKRAAFVKFGTHDEVY